MMRSSSQLRCLIVATLVGLVLIESGAHAYYFLSEQPAPQQAAAEALEAPLTTPAPPTQTIKETAKEATGKAQDLAGQAKEAISQAGNNLNQQQGRSQGLAEGQLPKRIQGHLSDLYSHGSLAVRGVVDQVQPDFKNIGRDINEAYQATRSEVGKRIEPLAQTVRPYIDQYVSPYVSQAREEVPKLINQAKPALNKVGEQVRGGINGVWNKIGGNQDGEKSPKEQVEQVGKDMKTKIENKVENQANEAAKSVSEAQE